MFVAVLAFLLASFPARNSDVFHHLAAGRSLAHGVSPAANPSWLHDLATYGLYSVAGGTGLVLAKAVLVAALSLLLLGLSWAGRGWAIPAACTALALLAMSLRLLLQPTTVSYFFLAAALWLLREKDEDSPAAPPVLPPWPLVLLFVVWVNVDRWFLLGLGVVALGWLGRALQERPLARSLLFRAVSVTLLGTACLLNPSHVHAFEAAPGLLGLGPSEGFRLVTSPFQEDYWANLGLNPAGLAYFPLLGLGTLSFLMNVRGWRWGRFLPWVGLALLSAWQVRTIPFFAVVAGPALALNIQEILARRGETAGARGARWVPVRLLALALLVCAWPGWLQTPPYEPRSWGVDLPPALQRGAEALARLREQGLPLGRGLHLSAETARAFAWFTPEEKGLWDLQLGAAILASPEASDGWAAHMRAEGVGHLIVYDADRDRLLATLDRLLGEPRTWPLLVLEGDLAVFGWRDPARGDAPRADPFRGREIDLDRLAFHPAEDRMAPRDGPEGEPEPRRWWEAFWQAAQPRAIDRDEATLYLLYAEALRRTSPYRRLAAWEAAQSAALAAAASGWAGPVALADAGWRLVLLRPPLYGEGPPPPLSQVALTCQQAFAHRQDDSPPALLYLTVRAARRAIAANPRDARAYQILGEGYVRLMRDTRERAWSRQMPELVHLRRAQAGAALNRAVALDPRHAQAHAVLADLYHEMGYLDLALRHLRAFRRLAGPAVGQRLDPEVTRLAEQVARLESEYQAGAGKSLVLERATRAFRAGLAGKARDLLLESDLAAFGPQGMALELELLLRTGRERDVIDWLSPEQRSSLGEARYHWLRTQALAASGEYALAEQECEALASERQDRKASPPSRLMALLVGQAILDGQSIAPCCPDLAWRALGRATFFNRVNDLVATMRQQAKADLIRGLLALERGDVETARQALTQALGLWAQGAGIDFLHRPVAEGYLQLLESGAGSRP